MGTVDWILGQTGLSLDDLDALAISVGPGSFTGLRVGVAAWKGLATGTGLPLVGVPTLDALVNRTFHDSLVCPLLDAKMGEVFGAVYRFKDGLRTQLVGARACPVQDMLAGLDGQVFFLGDGAQLYREIIQDALADAVFLPRWCCTPRASLVAIEALAMFRNGTKGDAGEVAPVYLRKSYAEQARDKAGAP
jgi:tRNA threonylcarbamoyladenosine biosynthesis protein TsaB